ncbi:MAG: NADPH-dependent 7-cyano-7-deazaguanine reductase QueF [Deltaproteobacteria bacterium]|nr:NADPH-dependent 7-cyano-7-deazaguanine reductase QueF [Deltaproteobacteria bacterium]
MKEDTSSLKHLGQPKAEPNYDNPSVEILDTFPNPYPDRSYTIQFMTREFTSLCPVTGQPDFATIEINYIPCKLCIESKSLKLYLLAYRQHGSFVETITNKILDDLVQACEPAWMEIKADFVARGGIRMNVRAVRQGNSGKENG